MHSAKLTTKTAIPFEFCKAKKSAEKSIMDKVITNGKNTS
jgi:hypothetical protein